MGPGALQLKINGPLNQTNGPKYILRIIPYPLNLCRRNNNGENGVFVKFSVIHLHISPLLLKVERKCFSPRIEKKILMCHTAWLRNMKKHRR